MNGMRKLRLVAREPVARTIERFRFEAVDGLPLEPVEPGAHVELHLGNGMARAYSLLTGPPLAPFYEIAVHLDSGGRGGSRHLHETLRVGDVLLHAGPRNHFPMATNRGNCLLIAGGVGITAILPMVRSFAERGDSWVLHYAARSREDAAFLEELDSLAVDSGGVVRTWFGEGRASGGRLDVAALLAATEPDTELYCCGPASMLQDFIAATQGRSGRAHWEYFQVEAAPAQERAFMLRLERSAMTLQVPPGKSILDVVMEAGVPVSFSCQEGVCGVCETVILQGAADHRDMILTPAEREAQKTMMICCSGSAGELLVLDL